ncbi:MAG: helix-turn-helix transcriptional regulator [Thermoanaerobacterales bacterium]|mgnify:CR=1 FL=1|jgi:DNA-binding PadR family transcriptional regulator|nr:PadR family transcriptional regulator [Thermoanaerobacterales bacterium]
MAVREGLMALLVDEPRHGYQLKTAFEAATGGVWRLNVGQVYSTLDRLHRDGLVAVDDTGEQKRYALTDSGRDALGAWWRATPADDPPPRDELQLKVLLAVEQGPEHALDVITRQRTALTRALQRHRRAQREAAGDASLSAQLVTDALVVRAEADLRWLDLCESRILRARQGRAPSNGGSP